MLELISMHHVPSKRRILLLYPLLYQEAYRKSMSYRKLSILSANLGS
ncbi:MAG: hypothetical protein QW187_03430 [Candidatus Korarchaeum sp.]